MALCEQCGSIRIVRARSSSIEKGLAVFTGRKPFTCLRCGWRGRRAWRQSDIHDPQIYGAAVGATTDPSMSVLDTVATAEVSNGKTGRKTRKRSQWKRSPEPANGEFDLSTLELRSHEVASADDMTPPAVNVSGWDERTRGIAQERLRRSRRRQVVGAVALSALALFLFSLLAVARSCRGDPGV